MWDKGRQAWGGWERAIRGPRLLVPSSLIGAAQVLTPYARVRQEHHADRDPGLLMLHFIKQRFQVQGPPYTAREGTDCWAHRTRSASRHPCTALFINTRNESLRWKTATGW